MRGGTWDIYFSFAIAGNGVELGFFLYFILNKDEAKCKDKLQEWCHCLCDFDIFGYVEYKVTFLTFLLFHSF